MDANEHISKYKSYPEQSRTIEILENSDQEKFFVATQSSLSKSSLKTIKKFSKCLPTVPNNSYILNIQGQKCKQFSKPNLKIWTSEIKTDYYTKPNNFFNLSIEDILKEFLKIIDVFKCFEDNSIPFINMLARNLKLIMIDGEISLKICPYTEKYPVFQHLTLEILTYDRYHRLLPRRNSNQLEFNYNKIAVFILGLKFLEFITNKKVNDKDTLQSIYENINNNHNWWVKIFDFMLQNDENNRLNFTQLQELKICTICKDLILLEKNICQKCACVECGIRSKGQADFCKKGLCLQCLNTGKYCINCDHFSFLPKEELCDGSEASQNSCLCGKIWLITENKLLCDCGEYCKICKQEFHTSPCYKRIQTTNIMCSCKNLAKRCLNTFYFSCLACNQQNCIVCFKSVVNISHFNCIQQLMNEKKHL